MVVSTYEGPEADTCIIRYVPGAEAEKDEMGYYFADGFECEAPKKLPDHEDVFNLCKSCAIRLGLEW